MARHSFAVLLLVCAAFWTASCCHCPPASPCVTFEPPLVAGTQYGAPAGQAPGAVAFTSSGIPVTVQNFTTLAAGTSFNSARIEVAPFSFGSGQSLRLNNIDVEFDFGASAPNGVTVQFLDM